MPKKRKKGKRKKAGYNCYITYICMPVLDWRFVKVKGMPKKLGDAARRCLTL